MLNAIAGAKKTTLLRRAAITLFAAAAAFWTNGQPGFRSRPTGHG